MRKLTAFCLGLICLTLASCGQKNPIGQSEPYGNYTIEMNGANYIISVYDDNGSILLQEELVAEPTIEHISPEIVRLSNGKGDSWWDQFVDVKNALVSPVYYNVSLVYDENIVYMALIDGSIKLVIRNMFDENRYYKEVVREFSVVAVPSSALVDAKLMPDHILRITYLSGEQYEERTEDIIL